VNPWEREEYEQRLEESMAMIKRQVALMRQLEIAIAASCAYFVLVGAGALVAALFLLDSTRSDDLTRVAALSLAGGALGAIVRALYEVMTSLEIGRWELSDGTVVERRLTRRRAVRDRFMLERALQQAREAAGAEGESEQGEPAQDDDLAPPPDLHRLTKEEAANLAAQEQERRQLGLSRSEYTVLRKLEDDAARRGGFSIYDLPLLILLPLLGAALGLVAFAGFVGGFLVATGSSSPSYSPAGLLFISALAGMFAPNFIASLARAADAIFGKTGEPPAPEIGPPS
jgi:hypothetical protein